MIESVYGRLVEITAENVDGIPVFVAKCLDPDVTESGSSPEEALAKMRASMAPLYGEYEARKFALQELTRLTEEYGGYDRENWPAVS